MLNRSRILFSIAANALCAGGVFMFPLFSPVLAQHFKFTQPQLTSIVLAGMAGQYPCTPLVGKIIDNQGPWLCSLIAALLFSFAFGSFSYMLEALENPPSKASVYFLVFLFALAGFATVFSYFSSLFAATRNFPAHPGIAAGTVLALFGLSPLFLSYIASNSFTDDTDKSLNLINFLVFLTILSGGIHIIGALNLRVPSNHPPITLPSEPDETTALLPNNGRGSALNLVRDPYFWVLFTLLVLTLGPCEMVISNVGTIALSLPSASATVFLGSPGAAASAQVKILAISNTVTRLLVGPLADFVSPIVAIAPPVDSSPKKHYISRAAFLVGAAVFLAFTFLWMEVVRSQADLWVLGVGTGIAYGATFTVLPSIITSVWGVPDAGRNFGIVVYAPLTGTIFSYLYAFVSAHHTSDGHFCRGPSCWQFTFWISAGMQVIAFFCGLILWQRWKSLL
ncbi:major facilitator superfamily domain-containing protein [Mycena rosella]|uniref:Probable transporter MCH1 n=1 Tax=Mycena rosella TaxID=1033263 RepID=A0AAD7H221_MYCRO|nr:major facilitator superfamily domain-containing protein [Mycena rosella]